MDHKREKIDYRIEKPYYPREVKEFFAQVSPGFFEGNVMKYVIRCEHESRRDEKIKDIQKAMTYLNMIGPVKEMPEKRVYTKILKLHPWQRDVIDSLMIGDLGNSLSILWCVRNLCVLDKQEDSGEAVMRAKIKEDTCPHCTL